MVNKHSLDMNVGGAESTESQRSVQRVAVGFAVEGDCTTDDLRDVLGLVVIAHVSLLSPVSLVDALVAAGVVLSTTVVSYAVSLSLLALSLVGDVVFALLSAGIYVLHSVYSLYSLYSLCSLHSLYSLYSLHSMHALYASGYSTLNSYDSDLALLTVILFILSLLSLVDTVALLSVVLLSLNVLLSLLSLVALVSLLSIVLLTLHAVYVLALADLVTGVREWVLSALTHVDVSILVPHGYKEEMIYSFDVTQQQTTSSLWRG